MRCVVRGAGGSSDTVVNHVKLGRYTSVVADVNKFVVNKIITGSLAQTLASEGGGAEDGRGREGDCSGRSCERGSESARFEHPLTLLYC